MPIRSWPSYQVTGHRTPFGLSNLIGIVNIKFRLMDQFDYYQKLYVP